jgi:hypothetical protein
MTGSCLFIKPPGARTIAKSEFGNDVHSKLASVLLVSVSLTVRVNGKSSPTTGLDRPTGFQEVEAPRFLDNRRLKVVRLSVLRTGRVYPPGNIPGTHFC